MKALTFSLLLFSICCCKAIIGPSALLATFSEDFAEFYNSEEVSTIGDDVQYELTNSPDATCNDSSFDKCNANFAKDLNITTPIKSALDFIKFLQRLMKKDGQRGFKTICKAFTNYKKCLGNSYSACANVDYFIKRGVKSTDAYIYVTIIYEFGYECSPAAQKVILDNWDCIASTEKEARPHFKKCVTDFMKQVKRQPKHVCPLAQKMVMCIDFPFGRKCNKAVVAVFCNTVKAGLKVSLPKCNISCPNATEPRDGIETVMAENNSDEDDVKSWQDIANDQTESVSVGYQSPISVDILSMFTDGSLKSCDDTTFRKAIDHYAQLFGFKKLPDSAIDFVKAVHSFVERQGKHGFKKTCDAGKEFYRRLGKDQYNLCVTQENFQSLGYSKQDAFIYIDLATAMFYECGDGYDVYFANFDCIINIGKQKVDELKKCGTDFSANVTKDPTHVCDYAQSMLLCVEKPYDDGCGKESGHAICMTGKAQMGHVMPKCKSISCDGEEMSTVHRVPLKKIFKKHRKIQDNSIRGGMGTRKFSDLFNNNEDF